MKISPFSVETSKVLAVKPAQEIEQASGAISALVEAVRQLTSAFLQRITIQDNLDCKVMTVEVMTATEQVINVTPPWGSSRAAIGIQVLRVISDTYGVDSFAWWVAADGTTKIKVAFSGSPGAATLIKVVLLIYYG